MGNLTDYFNNRSIDSLKEDYDEYFGQVLIKLYRKLIYWYEEENATRLTTSLEDGLKLFRGEAVIRDSKAANERRSDTLNENRLEAIKAARHHLDSAYINILPVILRKDKVMSRYMYLVEATDQYVEIKFIHPE